MKFKLPNSIRYFKERRSKVNVKKYIFYVVSTFSLLIFLLTGLITRGYSYYSLFQFDRSNYFMDFFNSISELFSGPYTHGSIYPPLAEVIYKILLRFVPYNIVSKGALAIRGSQSGEIIFLFYILVTLLAFFVLVMETKKGLSVEKYLFILIMLFSGPFLFEFERANIIFVVLPFTMVFIFFKDSKNRFIRELALISLAISVAIKIYPILFLMLFIKERRFKEMLKVIFYSFILLTVPFLMIGGVSQIPLFFKNLLYTTDNSLNWGLGYAVNIQNLTRILFAVFGNFSRDPVVIGRIFSLILFFLGLLSSFILKSRWKTVALISLLMILVPPISYQYGLIYMIIPLIIFLDNKDKMQRIDYFYLVCFILLFIPFMLGNIDFINKGFGITPRPLTYGVLIENIILVLMTCVLIIDGIKGWFIKRIKA